MLTQHYSHAWYFNCILINVVSLYVSIQVNDYLTVKLISLHSSFLIVSRGCYLKEGHYQVSHTQIDHEEVHGSVMFLPTQQHPQHESITQNSERKHQPQHPDLRLGQGLVPYPWRGNWLDCGPRGGPCDVLWWKQPEESPCAPITAAEIEEGAGQVWWPLQHRVIGLTQILFPRGHPHDLQWEGQTWEANPKHPNTDPSLA